MSTAIDKILINMKKKIDIISKIAKHFNVTAPMVYAAMGISRQRYHLAKSRGKIVYEWTPEAVAKVSEHCGIDLKALNSFLSSTYFG